MMAMDRLFSLIGLAAIPQPHGGSHPVPEVPEEPDCNHSGFGGVFLGIIILTALLHGCPDTTPPTVSSTVPSAEATAVSINGNLAAIFSETMDSSTISAATFTLRRGTTPVAGNVSYSGVTATFEPVIVLVPNTLYTATISAGAADLAGNPLAGAHVWTFTTGAAPDTTAPQVSLTDPIGGAKGVPLDQVVVATFSETMNAPTINSTTFYLRQGNTPVAGTVALSSQTATFNPSNGLAPFTQYTATVSSGTEDLAGNHLASDHVWSFTTGALPDTTAPTVTTTNPASGASGVLVNKMIAATFSEAMDPLSINTATFTLRQGATPVAGAVTYAGVTAIFTSSANLAHGASYTASLGLGATDLAGNPLASEFTWTFTTSTTLDTTAPTVSSTAPTSGRIGVPIGGNIAATFSEVMDPLTITTVTFTLDQGSTPIPGAVTYAGVTAVFNPSNSLAPNTAYTAAILMEVTDLAGNTLANDHAWSFTTGALPDTTPPTVTATGPAEGEVGVLVNKNLAATFSEAMDPSSITTAAFTLRQGTTPVAGTVTYAGVTAVFNPSNSLAPNTTYTATVWMEVTDLAGNPLAEDYVWNFTTGAASDTTAPIATVTAPAEGAMGVPLNSQIAVTFSEAIDPLTISTATFTLDQGITPISGTVIYANGTAIFTPAGGLTPDTTYTGTVWMEVTDLAGNPLAEDFSWTFTTGATTAQEPLVLASANAFAVLAGSTVSSTGPSIITGDLGVSPGTAVEGFPPGVLNGAMFTGVDSAAGQAKLDLTAAFNEAAGRSVGPVSLPGNLSGLTLYPGLYANSTSVMLSVGNVTLDAQGDANAVFLFQMGSTLTTGSSTQVILSGGAKAANVFWQVGTSATLGTTSIFKGNILSQASITLATGAALEGRALTQTGAVTLDGANITVPTPSKEER